jgi:hypothetical protein
MSPPPGYPVPDGGFVVSGVASATPDAAAPSPATSFASPEYAIGVDQEAYDDTDPSALTDFRAALEPYGAWTDDATYGTVWTPSADAVGPGFVPYDTAGHWAYDDDWIWVSDYAWGWAPFHYGRWVPIDGKGWAWIPGRVYRGAWVTWMVDDGNGYVGWAPLAPEFVWVRGMAIAAHPLHPAPVVVVPRSAVFAPALSTKVVVGPAAAAVGARMHPYFAVGVGRSGAGPAPARLGYGAGTMPKPAGAGAAGIEKAQQMSRRSAGAAAGASPGARVEEHAAPNAAAAEHPVEGQPARAAPAVHEVPRAAPHALPPPPPPAPHR